MTPKQEQDYDLLRRAAEQLGEHFDTVQIFTTRHESGSENGTVNVCYGVGNWYARYGQTQEWLLKECEASRVQVRKDNE